MKRVAVPLSRVLTEHSTKSLENVALKCQHHSDEKDAEEKSAPQLF